MEKEQTADDAVRPRVGATADAAGSDVRRSVCAVVLVGVDAYLRFRGSCACL